MAIKFSAKDQPATPAAAAKPVKPVAAKAGEAAEAATDLFKSPVDAPKGKTGKKK
ncbi:hypothetical protein ACFSOZ_37035 [Mesorhizobium newzealandense]|uniref:Uncharacterized protein n=1 Tax=Mesorhizobium newzealandense TaxID=1300302 RepID=A0ABW4UM40_9HYPH